MSFHGKKKRQGLVEEEGKQFVLNKPKVFPNRYLDQRMDYVDYMCEPKRRFCLTMTPNCKRFLIMITVSIITTVGYAIFDQCDFMNPRKTELLRKHDRWMIVYHEGFCGYIALPMYSVSNFVWTFKNSIKPLEEENCTNVMDFVTPKLETVRAVFMDRANMTSTIRIQSSDFYENYRFRRNVIFEHPIKNKIVQRRDFALSVKDGRIIAAYNSGNGTVKLYKCTPEQDACYIDHSSTLFLGRRFRNVKQIILHENRLHAVIYQKEVGYHVVCGTIIKPGENSRTVTVKEMPFTRVKTFAFFETRRGKEDVFLIIGHLANTPHATSPFAHDCYVVSEMCSGEIRAIATIHSKLLEKSVIQFVYVPKEYRLLNEKELNKRLSKQNLQTARDYLETLIGSEPPVFYKNGFDTVEQKIQHHLYEMERGKGWLEKGLLLIFPVKKFCKDYFNTLNHQILLNCWRFQFAMWIIIGLKMFTDMIFPPPSQERKQAATTTTTTATASRNQNLQRRKDEKNGIKQRNLYGVNRKYSIDKR